MRKLCGSDIFAALRVVRTANLREELKPVILAAAAGEGSVEDVGYDGVLAVLEAAAEKRCEAAIWEFLAAPFEKEPAEVAAMELPDLVDGLADLCELTDMQRFFGSVRRLMGVRSLTSSSGATAAKD